VFFLNNLLKEIVMRKILVLLALCFLVPVANADMDTATTVPAAPQAAASDATISHEPAMQKHHKKHVKKHHAKKKAAPKQDPATQDTTQQAPAAQDSTQPAQ